MARRFTWDEFDEETVCAIVKSLFDINLDDGARARRKLNAESFGNMLDDTQGHWLVYNAKNALIDCWLAKNPEIARHLVRICEHQRIGPRFQGSSAQDCLDYLRRRRATNQGLRELLLIELRDYGTPINEGDDGGVAPLRRLIPAKQAEDDRSPYPYQREVWAKLSECRAAAGRRRPFAGLIVMPTGSGKTYTTVHWLTENHINEGGLVLWVAHRHYLLDQAAFAFYRTAYLADKLPELRVRVISGAAHHGVPTQVDPEGRRDHVVIWSIGSAARNLDTVNRILAHKDVFLVVDEAHHAAARKTYGKLFELLDGRRNRKVLGLTATPTRTVADERPVLAGLFGHQKLVDVKLPELIADGYLAHPYLETIRTGVDAEKGATSKERNHLKTWRDLPASWQGRLAKIERRNRGIVQQYRDHRRRYGKTLIFAINIDHAKRLRKLFSAAGIEVDYVASDRPAEKNKQIVERFREHRSGLDVLINVEVLTEGVDIPAIQTVFLTRPTWSAIRLRQMIGRALRGRQMDGTEVAYLVSFADHWAEFNDWQSSFDLVQDIKEENVAEEPTPAPPHKERDLRKKIEDDVEELLQDGVESPLEVIEAVPDGWYVLEREEESEDGEETDGDVREIIYVYAHQRACWEALVDRLWSETAPSPNRGKKPSRRDKGSGKTTLADLDEEFFGDCDVPRPSQRDLDFLLIHRHAGGDRPEYVSLEARRNLDPYALAQEIIHRNLGLARKDKLIEKRYGEVELASAIYPTLRDFSMAVDEAVFTMQHPKEAFIQPKVECDFEPPPESFLRPGPCHKLGLLIEDTCVWGAELLGEKQLPFEKIDLDWTKQRWRSYFGKAWWEKETPRATGRIRINCVLNTPDVSADALRWLLWHEYLHLYLQAGHTPEFRRLERNWKDWYKAQNELDTLSEEFELDLKWK